MQTKLIIAHQCQKQVSKNAIKPRKFILSLVITCIRIGYSTVGIRLTVKPVLHSSLSTSNNLLFKKRV